MSIRSRVPWTDYRALPGVSITRLKELRRSAQHYNHAITAEEIETAPLRLGSASHCSVLEPERFVRDYAVWGERTDSGRLRPRNGKDWDAFAKAHQDKKIISADEHARAMAIQAAVRSDKTAMRYLASGDPEVTMLWETDGHACKGRVDWLTRVSGMTTIVGLKTARDCRDFIFASQAAKLGYHLQWSFYYDGHRKLTRRDAKVVEIVVESAPPFAVATFVITTDIIEQGRAEYRELLVKLADCLDRNTWPGPVEGEQRLVLPRWVFAAEDDGDVVEALGLEA